jgi:hypothetical protein
MFKVYRGEDVAEKFVRFEEQNGAPIWARFVWGEGVFMHGACQIPPGWTWQVLGWGDFAESAYMWEEVYTTSDAARAAFAKRFNVTEKAAPAVAA